MKRFVSLGSALMLGLVHGRDKHSKNHAAASHNDVHHSRRPMDVAPAVKRKFEEDSDDIERDYNQFSDEFSADNSDDVKIEKTSESPITSVSEKRSIETSEDTSSYSPRRGKDADVKVSFGNIIDAVKNFLSLD